MIWNNVKTAPNRWMAYWLRRQGWICFYLDEQARACGPEHPTGCWLALYEASEGRHTTPPTRWRVVR